MVRQGIQRSSQWENETTGPTVSYCWQTSFIIRSHLSPTENTPASLQQDLVEEDIGQSVGWCFPDRKPRSFDVEDATTLSWSSAAVSERVIY